MNSMSIIFHNNFKSFQYYTIPFYRHNQKHWYLNYRLSLKISRFVYIRHSFLYTCKRMILLVSTRIASHIHVCMKWNCVCLFLLLFFRLFVCFGGFNVSLEKFSLIWRSHHCWWRAWGFFSVPHLLRHGSSVYNGDLRGPVTLTPIAERLAVELPLPVSVAAGIRTPNLPLAGILYTHKLNSLRELRAMSSYDFEMN